MISHTLNCSTQVISLKSARKWGFQSEIMSWHPRVFGSRNIGKKNFPCGNIGCFGQNIGQLEAYFTRQ